MFSSSVNESLPLGLCQRANIHDLEEEKTHVLNFFKFLYNLKADAIVMIFKYLLLVPYNIKIVMLSIILPLISMHACVYQNELRIRIVESDQVTEDSNREMEIAVKH